MAAFCAACGAPVESHFAQDSAAAIDTPEAQTGTTTFPPQMTAADEAESAAAVASSGDSPGNPVDSIKPVEPGRDSGLGNRAVSPPDESPEAPGRVPGGPGAERCDDFAGRGEELKRVVSEEMDGFDGDWGFALIDIECRMEISVHAEHSQYPASAGKIVIVIAALRGVGDGSIESEPELFQDVEDILISSLGTPADRLAEQLSPEQISEVQVLAGVSNRSQLTETWRNAYFTPIDLARVWASLLRGELLDSEFTALVLDLAENARLPDEDGFWPFPAEFGSEGIQYGQKAGFWESDEPVRYRVSAGFVRSRDRPQRAFAFAFMARVNAEGLEGNWRRPVFAIVRSFVESEIDVRDLEAVSGGAFQV